MVVIPLRLSLIHIYKRAEAARERKMYRYKAFYSLDCDDGIENAAIGWAQPSPEDCLMEKEAQAESAKVSGAKICFWHFFVAFL